MAKTTTGKLKAGRWEFPAIGVVHTVFKEKFGIPRQPGLAPAAWGVIELNDDPDLARAVEDLEKFSHLWIVYVFHMTDAKNWKPSVRPPRLGGVKRVGVLASRSPHRPNPIGLSVVKLEQIERQKNRVRIHVSGVDILDGSPVLDLKPYLPYADVVGGATSGWADEPILRAKIEWSELAQKQVADFEQRRPGTRALIQEIIELDPRPAFQKIKFPWGAPGSLGKKFGMAIDEYDVKWEIIDQGFRILRCIPSTSGKH